jgi:hypothetical protein
VYRPSEGTAKEMPQPPNTRGLFQGGVPTAEVTKYTCPVCGFLMDDEPAYSNICPCCGVEFGYEDSGVAYADLRDQWVEAGMPWWSTIDSPPERWNRLWQLALAFGRNYQFGQSPVLEKYSGTLMETSDKAITQGQFASMVQRIPVRSETAVMPFLYAAR